MWDEKRKLNLRSFFVVGDIAREFKSFENIKRRAIHGPSRVVTAVYNMYTRRVIDAVKTLYGNT